MIASKPHTHCRACQTKLPESFLDLGMQPLANNLCNPADLIDHVDETFPMRLCRCEQCGLLQLDTVVDPATMFSHYLYTPSQSKKTLAHFEELARVATGKVKATSPFIVDIGSNDGALLRMFKGRGFRVCGVDPAENLVRQANASGLPTELGFFDDSAVDRILWNYGRVDLITACNVFAHTPDWEVFARCASRLLAPDGLLALEFPYGPIMLRDGTFDLIYFEHASYPAIRPVDVLFSRHGLYVQDVEDLPDIHGGSVRVWIGFEKKVDPSAIRKVEEEARSLSANACEAFAWRVKEVKAELRKAIGDAHAQGRRVLGFTAPAKCVTLLTACGVKAPDIDFIIDDNALKQCRLLPKLHIPIRSLKEAKLRAGDTVIVFAWNVAEDIVERLPAGVDVIIPMPTVKVIC